MNEIVPNLWIGNLGDASQNYLEPEGGKFLIDVRWPGEHEMQPYSSSARLVIPTTIYDVPKNTVTTHEANMGIVGDIIEALIKTHAILVHCTLGMERSPLTVVWYLMHHWGYSLNDAYTIIKQKHPETIEHRDWLPTRIR